MTHQIKLLVQFILILYINTLLWKHIFSCNVSASSVKSLNTIMVIVELATVHLDRPMQLEKHKKSKLFSVD